MYKTKRAISQEIENQYFQSELFVQADIICINHDINLLAKRF